MSTARVRSVVSLLVIAVVMLVRVASAYGYAFTLDELRCRQTVASSTSRLATTSAGMLGSCHRKRSAGQVAASTDCNSIAAVDSGSAQGATEALNARVVAACTGLDPASVAYVDCPPPCDAVVPAIADFDDVAACLDCLTRTHVEDMTAESQGNPSPPLTGNARTCHGAIGKRQSKYFKTFLRERYACQRAAEYGGADDLSSCESADPRGKIELARLVASDALLTACAGAALAPVDSCSETSAQALTTCVLDGAEEHGQRVFEASYQLGTETTTTTTTTTTTLPPQDPQCPEQGELVLLAGTGAVCSSNGDCVAGSCDPGLGRCTTVTELDSGWTGFAHDTDINGEVTTRSLLRCPGPFNGSSPEPCGQCFVVELLPDHRICRCNGDTRQICDEPFQPDIDNCGGAICNCYLGPPLPLSSGNTPVCVVNQLRNDVGGTVNVDTGAASLRTDLLSIVYLGETLVLPCPYCTGDVVAADGNRDGTCVAGQNAGQTCDTDAFNYSFPAPGGAGHSLDCYPTTGKNITGLGLRIDLRPTTGTTPQISANLPCFFGTDTCHCLLCSGDQSIPCDSDADCAAAGAGTCSAGASSTQENSCNGGACTALDPSEGECTTGPDDHFCDAVLRADGEGFVFCNDNADCTNSTCGAGDCGSCTLTQRRRCFPQSFQAAGVPDPARPIMASTFCIPKTANTGVNSTAGLPGPAKVVNQSRGQSFCASDPGVAYTPGVGGCP